MKRIRNEVIVSPFNDKPLIVNYGQEKNADGKPLWEGGGEVAVADPEKALKDPDGRPIPKLALRDQNVAWAIRNFLERGIQASKELTLMDSSHALRVLDALRPFKLLDVAFYGKAPKEIALEDADYEWLLNTYKDKAPAFHGILAKVFVDALENLEKLDEPKAPSDNGAKAKILRMAKPL